MRPGRRLFESMTRLPIGTRVIRVWRHEKSFIEKVGDARVRVIRPDNSDLKSLVPMLSHLQTDREMLAVIERWPRVSAIEILDADGNGILQYHNWP